MQDRFYSNNVNCCFHLKKFNNTVIFAIYVDTSCFTFSYNTINALYIFAMNTLNSLPASYSILITGGAGYIGSHITRLLHELKYS